MCSELILFLSAVRLEINGIGYFFKFLKYKIYVTVDHAVRVVKTPVVPFSKTQLILGSVETLPKASYVPVANHVNITCLRTANGIPNMIRIPILMSRIHSLEPEACNCPRPWLLRAG